MPVLFFFILNLSLPLYLRLKQRSVSFYARGIGFLEDIFIVLELFLIAFVYELISKREGMGGGDIKLLAMIGGFFGWKSLIFILLFSSFSGAIVGITAMIIKKQDMKYAVPFGPFLSAAAVAYLFWGDTFMRLLVRGY